MTLDEKVKTSLLYDIVLDGISLLDTKQKELNTSFNRVGAEATLLQIKSINHKNKTVS